VQCLLSKITTIFNSENKTKQKNHLFSKFTDYAAGENTESIDEIINEVFKGKYLL
jgi:hypothetical protein